MKAIIMVKCPLYTSNFTQKTHFAFELGSYIILSGFYQNPIGLSFKKIKKQKSGFQIKNIHLVST